MKMKGPRGRILLCTLASLLALPALSQSSPADSVTRYKNNLLPSPSVTYRPETDIVIGAYLLYQFKPRSAGPETRSSNLQFWVASSLKDQTFLTLTNRILTAGEKWFFDGQINSKFFPEVYYGQGNGTPSENAVRLEYDNLEIKQKVYRSIKPRFFVGPSLRYSRYYNVVLLTQAGDTIPTAGAPGFQEKNFFGVGAFVLRDLRNRIITPTRNHFLEFGIEGYAEMNPFDAAFLIMYLDGRKYYDLKNDERQVVALQSKFKWVIGDPHFRETGLLGGSEILRGYLEGRYRDHLSLQLQAEYRRNLIGRFGMTGFLGVGNVSPGFNDIILEKVKAAVGLGIRFNVNRKDPANVRIDYGIGIEDGIQGLYITFGEAF